MKLGSTQTACHPSQPEEQLRAATEMQLKSSGPAPWPTSRQRQVHGSTYIRHSEGSEQPIGGCSATIGGGGG